VTTDEKPASQGRTLAGQATRFVVVGLFAAVVDLCLYQLALHLGLWVHAARAASFICGTTVAYLLNRRWAFQTTGGTRQATGFGLLYSTTFCLIIGVNALALAVLPETDWTTTAGWVISQGIGTLWNFIMLRTVVFRP
jgi:putative flippase GtrA